MSKSLEAKTLLSHLLTAAQSAGADAADCAYSQGQSLSVTTRSGDIEALDHSNRTDIGLRVFVDGKVAHVSTSDPSLERLSALAVRAVDMAKASPEDLDQHLACPEDYATQTPDLNLYSDDRMDEIEGKALALRLEKAVLSCDGIGAAENATASWGEGETTLASSEGFLQSQKKSRRSLSVMAIARNDDGMERDYDHDSAIMAANLDTPEEIAHRAAKRAVRALGGCKLATRENVSVVFEPRTAQSLLSHFSTATAGSAVVRGGTLLKERMGEQLFRSDIEIVDDPHRLSGLRSRPWDDEGIACSRRVVVEGGVLKSWFLDLRTARRLGLKSTGHSNRSVCGPSSPTPTNLYIAMGESTPQSLMKNIDEGVFVTGLMGGGANIVTGDYSRGVNGFRISRGEICEPIHEMTLAGNLLDMFRSLRAANDLKLRYGFDSPTLRIDNMTLAGH